MERDVYKKATWQLGMQVSDQEAAGSKAMQGKSRETRCGEDDKEAEDKHKEKAWLLPQTASMTLRLPGAVVQKPPPPELAGALWPPCFNHLGP